MRLDQMNIVDSSTWSCGKYTATVSRLEEDVYACQVTIDEVMAGKKGFGKVDRWPYVVGDYDTIESYIRRVVWEIRKKEEG